MTCESGCWWRSCDEKIPYSNFKFKQNDSIFAHHTWVYGASHLRLLFGNTVNLLKTICHSSCPGVSWGPERLKDAWPGCWSKGTLHLPSHGARVVFTCSKKGSLPWRGASPAWAGRGDGAAPSLSQQHLSLPSHSCALPALCTPDSFPAAFGKWGAFSEQLQLKKKML